MNLAAGISTVRSYARRSFLVDDQGLAVRAVKIGNFSNFRAGVDSKSLLEGTVLALCANSACYVPFLGCGVKSPTIATSKAWVFVESIGYFAIGDNVKVGKPGPQNLYDSVELDLGAVLSIHVTSKSFAVTAANVVSDTVAGDYVWVEPATADGTGDPVAVLAENVTLRDEVGTASDVNAEVYLSGFLKSAEVYGLCNRAKMFLSGQGLAAPKANFRFDS